MSGPRARAVVDLGAIAGSTQHLCATAGTAAVMAVVKADAYGHGLVPVARAALAGGATWLGTAFVEEALALRAAGVTAPVLSWLIVPGEDLAPAVAAEVDLSASAPWAVASLVVAATRAGRPARVHLKVDTGLSRAGARAGADWDDLCVAAAKAQAAGEVEVVGVWSHLVHGDEPHHPTTDAQVAAFDAALATAARHGLRPTVRHLANSGGTLRRPDTHYDLVRPGIAVYGLSPFTAPEPGLRPAMTLEVDVALTKQLPAGQGVSYGHHHVTTGPTGVALLPLGYADGIPRAAQGRAEVQLAGRRRPLLGRVCMDQVVVDLGGDAVAEGETAVVFGPGDAGEPTAHEWAAWLDTISYEVVCGIGARVPRQHVGVA